MSREEIGTAPADFPAPGRGSTPDLHPVPAAPRTTATPAPAAPPRTPRRHTRRLRSLALLAALLGGGLAGWAGADAWDGAPASDAAGPVAWATVVSERPASTVALRTGVELVVRLANLGRAPLTLAGVEPSLAAGSINTIEPARLAVRPGARADVVVHAAVACASPQPLQLPALQVRGEDRVLRSVEVAGASASLVRVCQSALPAVRVLTLADAQPDGDRLRLTLLSPTGRTTQVLAISAAGVPLTGRPLPTLVAGVGQAVWLNPVFRCPSPWTTGGLPRALTIDLDVGGPATVRLDGGYALVRWLLAGPCSGVAP